MISDKKMETVVTKTINKNSCEGAILAICSPKLFITPTCSKPLARVRPPPNISKIPQDILWVSDQFNNLFLAMGSSSSSEGRLMEFLEPDGRINNRIPAVIAIMVSLIGKPVQITHRSLVIHMKAAKQKTPKTLFSARLQAPNWRILLRINSEVDS